MRSIASITLGTGASSCDAANRAAGHTERIVGERDLRIERRVETLGREVLHPAERIDELALGQSNRHRVHGEVAPRQVGPQVLAERDDRLAVLGRVHLLAERGDLEQYVAAAGAHRPEPHPDQVDAVRPATQDLRDLPRQRFGREVQVVGVRATHEQVPDDPAHEVELETRQAEAFAELGGDGGTSRCAALTTTDRP